MSLSAPELLTEKHDVSQFSCGKPSLDHWLKTRALSNQRKGFTVVMVVHEAGRGVASGLLKHALRRCVEAARLVGGRAVLVNAVDAEAARWWRARGFVPTKDDALLLFRSVADIAASVGAAD